MVLREDQVPPLTRGTLEAYGRRTVDDVRDLVTAPVRWRSHEWVRLGEAAALVGATYAFDRGIADAIRRNQHGVTNRYLKDVTKLGGGLGENLTIAAIVGGYLSGNARLMNSGMDAFESSLWASGVVTPAIKYAAGRARPIQGEGPHSYHSFDIHYASFPSGHSTNAWAIATAIATRNEDRPVVAIVAYTLATSVSIARVNERAHWPSDVVAGALIGRAIAKSIVHDHLTITPAGRGVVVKVEW